jgi:hypothetical protein
MLGAMTYRRPLAAALVALGVAACGGSSPSTSATSTTASSAATATAPSTAATTATATAPPPTASTPASTSTPATTTTHSSRPPEVPAGSGHNKTAPRPTVSSGAIIPAPFLIGPGGAVSPPSVAVPAGVSISLGVTNRDHRAHTVTLAGARHATLHLRAGAGAVTVVSGLPKGTYDLMVDGTAKASVVVGAQGGP